MPETFKREIYLLRPEELNPETIAVAFAKTSRSPLSFREIAAELTDEKSAEFHERWVVGYGHASVAEHAVLHLALENVSRLAIECIESNRLASYTEKSTRYQKWDRQGYFVPPEIQEGSTEKIYRQTCDSLFDTYMQSIALVKDVVARAYPRAEGESEERWDGRIRSHYIDACRFLLPAASLANVGMTANARVLEHAVRKMLSHPLSEVQEIGERVKEVSRVEIPTLVKYADRVPYFQETGAEFSERATALPIEPMAGMLELIDCDPEAELRILAAALYAPGGASFAAAMKTVREMEEDKKRELAEALLGRLDRFDAPLRELEHAYYTFDATLDQGAYFELKRHRMMTQTPQRLSADLGYAVPRLIVEAGFEAPYRRAMKQAAEAFGQLKAWNPHVAAYLVPNGFNRRVLMTLNLREVYHFCELRSENNAHFSIRRIALRMAEMIREVHPLVGAYLRLPQGVDWREIEDAHFTQV
ncbi:MAG: FAD-dependent thymidylate synthase [Anaerolineales bacterium]|nr:FAD-dependent thymidylate synthase [Anaerolineales bacterium]